MIKNTQNQTADSPPRSLLDNVIEESRKQPGFRGQYCFNSAFCACYYMKVGAQTEGKQWIWVFKIHSARSNENSLVPVAHMHGIAWHRQIWQTLKQNTFDVFTRVGEEAGAHFQSVSKFSVHQRTKGIFLALLRLTPVGSPTMHASSVLQVSACLSPRVSPSRTTTE